MYVGRVITIIVSHQLKGTLNIIITCSLNPYKFKGKTVAINAIP